MSYDPDQPNAPPEFGADDDDIKPDESMYVSATSPGTVDVPLGGADDDYDEDDPFGERQPRKKTPTDTTNTVEASGNVGKEQGSSTVQLDDDADDDDPFGEKKVKSDPPAQVPVATPRSQPSSPIKQESDLYPKLNVTSNLRPLTSSYENINVASAPVLQSSSSEKATASKPAFKRSGDETIEITVSDPTKVGDGMSSYMTYRITTKTSLSIFQKPEFTVNRRFSDFLGLHTKVVRKHLQKGIIVPSPPEKDTVAMAKVKIANEETIPANFIDRRRALLERYLNRLARNDKLIEDSDVRDFLENPNDLPKSKDTQAISGAGVLRVFSNISNSVNKLTTKTGEQDQWFEEKHNFIVELHSHLKHTCIQLNTLFAQRKEAGHVLKQFSSSLNHLATVEEHTSLSSALTELANLQEKFEQINNEFGLKEYSVLTELMKEYLSLLDMVQLAFNERIKTHQNWLHAEETLKKKREAKVKLEQSPKGADKLPQAEMEIRDWEGRVEQGKQDFDNVSATIKDEMETFEQTRFDDFKQAINTYLQNLLEQQEKILNIWENYLPEANKISA